MSSQNRAIRDQLRATVAEVCETMRAQKRAVERVTAEFKLCARRSRDSIKTSEEILLRVGAEKPG